MANDETKKLLEEDFTNQAQATTKADVDAQDARTRLWQSLNYSYGRQKEQSDEAYRKAISQSDRSMLQRGMQRSSYGAQVQANLMNDQIKAQNDIDSAFIADYQNRISQIEQQEAEAERWQKEFDEGQRQFNENLSFQQSEAQRAQSNFEVQQAFAEKQWETQVDQWKQEFNYNKKSNDQKIAYDYLMQMISNGKTPSSSLIKRAGLSSSDVKKMTKSANSSNGVVTWRQSADAAAKKLGFTGRNDPRYIAYLQNGNQKSTKTKKSDTGFDNLFEGTTSGNNTTGNSNGSSMPTLTPANGQTVNKTPAELAKKLFGK